MVSEEQALALYRSQLKSFQFSAQSWHILGRLLGAGAFVGGLTAWANITVATVTGFIAAVIVALQPGDQARRAREAADHLRTALDGRDAGQPLWTIDRIGSAAREALEIRDAAEPSKTPKRQRNRRENDVDDDAPESDAAREEAEDA